MSGEGGFNDEAYDSGMQAILAEDKEAGGEMTITDWTEVHESFDAMNLHENPQFVPIIQTFQQKPLQTQQQCAP